jgi:hypothetical protein
MLCKKRHEEIEFKLVGVRDSMCADQSKEHMFQSVGVM